MNEQGNLGCRLGRPVKNRIEEEKGLLGLWDLMGLLGDSSSGVESKEFFADFRGIVEEME